MEKQKEENSDYETNIITQEKDKDGGWGWVIVASAFMAHVLADGMLFTLGILYIEFLDEFKEGKGKTAWITSLIPGTMLTVGPITGALTNRFGCRSVCILGALIATTGFIISCFATSVYFLYCSLGILTGIGFGGIFLSTLVCVGQHFEKRRSFALGISVSGSGVGTFVFAPVVRILIDEYGWRGAILLEAGFILNIVLCGAFFRPVQNKINKTDEEYVIRKEAIYLSSLEDKPITNKQITKIEKNENEGLQASQKESGTSPDSSDSTVASCFSRHFDFGLLTNPIFTIFVVSNYFTALGFNTPYVYLPDRAEEKGMSQFDSAFLLSIIGISNTFGRIIFGWIADQKCVNRLLLYSMSLIICGTANVLNPLNDSNIYLMMYSAVYGTFIGVFVSLNTVILVDLLGSKRLDKALGLLMMFQGFGTLIGPPICGWLYDGTGSYSIPFYFVGGLVIFSGVVLCFIPLYRRNKTKNLYGISRE
ncbi:monocarboxylate transporter 12-like [Mytilus trossulus]|uniref:monocarboxylate transporter 12-like n=1 Tax=Mytilus trossulus TaxID=6551 RepID=UPI0030078D8B